jgi:hypothetical protein
VITDIKIVSKHRGTKIDGIKACTCKLVRMFMFIISTCSLTDAIATSTIAEQYHVFRVTKTLIEHGEQTILSQLVLSLGSDKGESGNRLIEPRLYCQRSEHFDLAKSSP